jgi:hypothetical protein
MLAGKWTNNHFYKELEVQLEFTQNEAGTLSGITIRNDIIERKKNNQVLSDIVQDGQLISWVYNYDGYLADPNASKFTATSNGWFLDENTIQVEITTVVDLINPNPRTNKLQVKYADKIVYYREH